MGIAGPSSPTLLLPGAYYAPPASPVIREETNRARSSIRARPTKMTLASMATRVILRNINLLNSLAVIEESSPHLQESTEEIWQKLVISDFLSVRKEQGAGTFKRPKSWRKMYLRLKGKEEQAKEAAGARLREKSAALKAEKEARKVVIADSMASIKLSKKKYVVSTPLTRGQNMMTKARQAGLLRGRLTTAAAAPLPAANKPASFTVTHNTPPHVRPTLVVRGGGASMSIRGPAGRSMQSLSDRIETLENPPKPLSVSAPRQPPPPEVAPARPRLNAADLAISNHSYTTKSRSQVEKERGDAVLLNALGKRKASDYSTTKIRITTHKRHRVEAAQDEVQKADGDNVKAARSSASGPTSCSPPTRRQSQPTGPSIFMPRQRV